MESWFPEQFVESDIFKYCSESSSWLSPQIKMLNSTDYIYKFRSQEENKQFESYELWRIIKKNPSRFAVLHENWTFLLVLLHPILLTFIDSKSLAKFFFEIQPNSKMLNNFLFLTFLLLKMWVQMSNTIRRVLNL